MYNNKRKTICFIDDDPNEVEVFERVFGSDFKVIAATKLDTVIKELRHDKSRANLFILDLYFLLISENRMRKGLSFLI